MSYDGFVVMGHFSNDWLSFYYLDDLCARDLSLQISGNVGANSQTDRSSASPSSELWFEIRRSSYWTRPPANWMLKCSMLWVKNTVRACLCHDDTVLTGAHAKWFLHNKAVMHEAATWKSFNHLHAYVLFPPWNVTMFCIKRPNLSVCRLTWPQMENKCSKTETWNKLAHS